MAAKKIKKKKITLKSFTKKKKFKIRRIKPHKQQVKQLKEGKAITLSKTIKSLFTEGPLFKAKIKVIGIGGGGSSIISEMSKSLKKATFLAIDTDIRALKKNTNIKNLCFGQEVTGGLGTGMNPELAKQAAEKEREKFTQVLESQDIIILVACLGGGVSSGAASVFADVARNKGKIALGIFTLPFKFEGKRKFRIAHKSLQTLKEYLNASIIIPNEKIFKIISNATPITEAFSIVNKNLIKSLESLIDIIYNPGLINIDFADLRTILKGNGKLAFLNTYEASGKNKADQTIKNIFTNPLYNSNLIAEKILFNIAGGNNLSMVEVEKISKSIANLNPKAKIIFGISKRTKSKNKIKTTLLIVGSARLSKLKKIAKKIKKAVAVKPKRLPTKKIIKKTKPKTKKREKIKIVKKSKKKKPAQKPTLRRSALEIKMAQDAEENKKLIQEEEWEIPAFLRRIKFKT